MKLWNSLSIIFAVIGGFLSSMLGGWDILVKCVVLFMVFDYITGVLKAIYTKKLSSYTGFKGILKKIAMMVIIAVSVSLQTIITNNIPLRQITIMFFICNEGISILENCAVIIPLPQKLKDVLNQIRDKDNK